MGARLPTMADRGAPPVLSDGVVMLRPLRASDVDDITAGCQDPETIRWTTIPSPYARTDAEQWVAAHPADDTWWQAPTWAITHGDDRWGGSIDLRLDGQDGAEVGYAVAPRLRGQQVATRSLRLACAWGFNALRLRVITWHCLVGNHGSRAVAAKCGFHVHRDVLRRGVVQRGERADVWIGELLPEDLASGQRRDRFSGPTLTAREREVLDLIAAGHANRTIATTLKISENTVKNHVRSILEKLQAHSRVDAVVRGVQAGLTRLP